MKKGCIWICFILLFTLSGCTSHSDLSNNEIKNRLEKNGYTKTCTIIDDLYVCYYNSRLDVNSFIYYHTKGLCFQSDGKVLSILLQEVSTGDGLTYNGVSEMNKEFEAVLQRINITASDLNRLLCDETFAFKNNSIR